MRHRLGVSLSLGLACVATTGCLTSRWSPTRVGGPTLARPVLRDAGATTGGTPVGGVTAAGYRPETVSTSVGDISDPGPTTTHPNVKSSRYLAMGMVSVGGLPYPSSAGDAADRGQKNEVLPSRWEHEQQPSRAAELPKEIVDEPVLLCAVRCYLENRPQDAVPQLAKIEEPSRQVLVTLLPLTVRAAEGRLSRSDPEEISLFVDGLQVVLGQLRPRAALVMDKLCFCRLIRGFGKIDALEGNPSFLPGEMVDVYLELRNVTSRPHRTERGDFRTHLRSQLEIRNREGQVVWGPQQFDKPDDSLTPQHDYYQHYRLQVPSLPPGRYTLHLAVRDVPTGRTVERDLAFTVGPGGTTVRPE